MKNCILTPVGLGLLATTGFLVSVANAQQDATRQTGVNADRQQINRSGNQTIGVLDEETTGSLVRASELMGTNIENSQGEGVGEIEDLVIDGNSGQVRYVAVTYGGFLGLGDKLFAVPFEAFQVRQEDEDDYVLTLDVTQEKLEGAEGFDDENWPNFADRNFTSELDRRYGIDRSPRQARNPNQGFNRNNVDNQNRINNRNEVNRNNLNNQNDLNNQDNNLNGDIGTEQNQDRQNR